MAQSKYWQRINFLSLLIICLLLSLSNSQCCLKFNGNDCVTCPDKMHIYRGNCIYDIANCKQYSNGFDCSICNVGFKLENNKCTQIPKPEPKAQPKSAIQPQVKPAIQPQAKTQTKPSTQPEIKPQLKPQVKSQQKSQQKQYQQIIITLPLDPTSSDQKQERASVVEQILRSTYSEIRSAQITKAFDRIYPNGTKIVELIFKANQKNKQVLYQALMMADIDTFIFKEISFGKYNPNSNTTNEKNNAQTSNPQDNKTGGSQPTNTSQNQINPSKNSSQENKSNPIQNASSQMNNTSPVPPQPQKTVTPALSKEQQEYSTLKFIHLSDLDALMDINFVLALNQINQKVSQLEGQVPSQIKVQEGYNNSALKVVHYIISFDVQQDGKPITYQIKLKVETSTSKVTIDAVYKKHPSQSSQSNQTQSSTNQSTSQIKVDEKTSSKSSYTEISADPSQAEVHFLIFLDNLGKNIEKKLSQSGQKPGENQIVFAGKYDSKDSINYWVQTKVTFSNQSKILYKVVGSINKMTYEVKINDITSLGEQKTQATNPVKTQPASSNLKKEPQPTPTVQPPAPGEPVKPFTSQPLQQTNVTVIKQYQESKQVLNPLNQANHSQTVTDPIKPVETTKTPEITALTPNSSVSGVITISTNTSSNQTQQKNSSPTVQTPKPVQIPIQNKFQTVQPPKPAEPQTFPTPTPQTQKPQPKPSTPQISSQVFQQINETIYDKSAGFQEIKITDNMKDEGLSKVSDTLLLSRQGRQNKKVYKAFIKNFGIKAQYKIYFIDTTTNSPKIDLYQGYASFDLLRKRVFVIAFSPLNI